MHFKTLQNTDLGPTLLDTWKTCGGYYECPKDSNDKLLGPLVGYAGKYQTPEGPKNWVGTVYYNFAKVEEHHRALHEFAGAAVRQMWGKVDGLPHVIVAAPMGGIIFGQAIAEHADCRYVFAEKKVVKAAQEGRREESILVLDRHKINKGDKAIIAEDVTNNFSTTSHLLTLVERAGGEVLGIICALNRSPQKLWHPGVSDLPIPVISALHIETPEYRQDNPCVVDYIAKGQIVWKPKDQWEQLAEAMAAHA